jgi:2',3'-cyclic-nucleotide 2'-phosphodiesterase (5'-nucleotidase family)
MLSKLPAGRQRLHVLFTSDVYGRYAWPGCGKPKPANRADFSQLVEAIKRTKKALVSAKEVEPLVIHAGSLLRLDVLGELSFAPNGLNKKTAAELLAAARFDAVSLGLHDFGALPATFATYLRFNSALPFVSNNVSCKKNAKEPSCRYLARTPRYRIVRRGEWRIGIVSAARSDLVARISERARGAFKVVPPVRYSRQLIRELRRKHRVDLVIALAELNVEDKTPAPVYSWVRRLGEDAPDIVVAGQMFDRAGRDYVLSIRRGRGAVILGTNRFGQRLGHAAIQLERINGRLRIRDVDTRVFVTSTFTPAAQHQMRVDTLRRELCRVLDRSIGGRFAKPLSQARFLDYMLEILRKQLAAEIGIINFSSVADTSFPMSGSLTREKLMRAIRTPSTVGTLTLTGSRIVALLGGHVQDSTALHVLGLKKERSGWLVNGRPLIEGQRYRVVTTAFVASGGEKLLSGKDLRFEDQKLMLRQQIRAFFEKGGAAGDGDSTIDLERDFTKLGKRWLLAGTSKLGLAFGLVALQNGQGGTRYSRPLLSRDDLASLTFDLQLFGSASTIDHVFEADLQLQYGQTWTRPQSASKTTAAEAQDRIAFSLIYRFDGLPRRLTKRWFVPIPYGELTLLSEFTSSGTYVDSAKANQTFHLFDLAGGLGLGWTLHPLLFAKIGFVVRGELLTPEAASPDLPAHPGLYFGYTLRQMKLLTDSRTPLELSSRLDFHLTDLSGEVRRDLTWSNQLAIQVTEHLRIALNHRLYVFDTKSRPASVANDLTVGINLQLDTRHQFF